MQHDRISRTGYVGFVEDHDAVVRPGQASNQSAEAHGNISCNYAELDAVRNRWPGLTQPILDRASEQTATRRESLHLLRRGAVRVRAAEQHDSMHFDFRLIVQHGHDQQTAETVADQIQRGTGLFAYRAESLRVFAQAPPHGSIAISRDFE